ncbi:hypothetical protein C0J52_09067 [Blattella germanica]|nr:hypothetical protein C0J52_09067 [Blattella germanica]
MAAVVRILQSSALRRSITLSKGNYVRAISTSKKNRDTVSVDQTADKNKVIDFSNPEKQNWVSYGFDHEKQQDDTDSMHASFFFSITFVPRIEMCIRDRLYTYYPDVILRDWGQREAYLELKRREDLGLPLIDRNLIDPAKIDLPSDEELGETEIII